MKHICEISMKTLVFKEGHNNIDKTVLKGKKGK